jgi:hypothetical protein
MIKVRAGVPSHTRRIHEYGLAFGLTEVRIAVRTLQRESATNNQMVVTVLVPEKEFYELGTLFMDD